MTVISLSLSALFGVAYATNCDTANYIQIANDCAEDVRFHLSCTYFGISSSGGSDEVSVLIQVKAV